MLESQLEQKCMGYARANGWWEVKIMRCSRNGIPDRVLGFNGHTVFVEFKQPNGRLSPFQQREHATMRRCGMTVWVIDSYEMFKGLIDARSNTQPPQAD